MPFKKSAKATDKVDSKKRMRDGKPKKVPAPKGAPEGKGKAPQKDEGAKKMMNEKESFEAIKDYMIKVSLF